MNALLLRRHDSADIAAHEDRSVKEILKGVTIVHSLTEAVDWIKAYNERQGGLEG